jgi:hypothetical protein
MMCLYGLLGGTLYNAVVAFGRETVGQLETVTEGVPALA